MATKTATPVGALGKMHTAGIYSNMTVDGPNIGTLVVIMDRAKNLPNRRSMGKQDPYCAARLGKEAKKTNTDKRGGQTPRWDQELRFPVHDSPDYHSLKVSVFNDDKKTELIGETWVSLEDVLLPGGGQSDGWHGLNCKGKYAGEIRIELTYYDTRPKAEKPAAERRRESARPEGGSPAVGGPRESAPVKRRPLPTGPGGASGSPAGTPEHRGLSGLQSGPRAYGTPPLQQRTNEHTSTHQRRSQHPDSQQSRRSVPDSLPLDGDAVSGHQSTHHQQRAAQQERDAYSASSPNPPLSGVNTPQHHNEAYDTSYAAPKPYEVQPIDPLPQMPREHAHRAMTQDHFRSSHGRPSEHIDIPHSYSAPVVPTQHADGYANGYTLQQESYANAQNLYQESQLQVAPLRTSRSSDRVNDRHPSQDAYHASNGYSQSPNRYDPFVSSGRPAHALQPTVEDEDADLPPPPPVHRSSATTLIHHQERPPSYHNDAPAPLNVSRFRDDIPTGYDSPPQSYETHGYSAPSSTERRYTHPRPVSRPVSRDTMAPSPLRSEVAMLPASLVPGMDPSRLENRMVVRGEYPNSEVYQDPPSYETPPRLRQYSEPQYQTPPHYESQPPPHQLVHHHSMPATDPYHSYDAPEEPRHTSPVHDNMQIVKPRAVSPGDRRGSADYRADYRSSNTSLRNMPTRKSVSPRPPPLSGDSGERRLSGVPFDPDSFDVYNPTVSKKSQSGANNDSNDGRPGSSVEVNDKGQVVTFSGRVIDASDHLPLDSWAPEPEPKGKQKDRPVRERAVLGGARDLEAAKQRERQYRKEREERERIRSAVDNIHKDSGSPSTALVTSRHQYSSSSGSPMGAGAMVLHETVSTPPGAGGRNRLQKRGNQRPISSYEPSNTEVLRERENLGGYGSSPGYGAGSRHAAPPIPAKVPLESDYPPPSEDLQALSLELQSIDIGPGSGGRHRGAARRRYDGY